LSLRLVPLDVTHLAKVGEAARWRPMLASMCSSTSEVLKLYFADQNSLHEIGSCLAIAYFVEDCWARKSLIVLSQRSPDSDIEPGSSGNGLTTE
jgi:hypothetical protein